LFAELRRWKQSGVDLGEALSRLALEQHRAMHAVPLQGGDPILHQSAPSDDQLLHVVERLAHGWAHGRLEERCKAGEHRSIYGISLGVPTDCLGKATGLTGVYLSERQPGLGELSFEAMMVGPGWLEHDAADRKLGEPGDQPQPPPSCVGEPASLASRMEVDIERVFGDVHADRLHYRLRHLLRVLCLSSGPQRPGIRSGHQEKRGAVTL
jgi:hypothetical protein